MPIRLFYVCSRCVGRKNKGERGESSGYIYYFSCYYLYPVSILGTGTVRSRRLSVYRCLAAGIKVYFEVLYFGTIPSRTTGF